MKIILNEKDLENLREVYDITLRGSNIEELVIPRELTKEEFDILRPSITMGNNITAYIVIKQNR